ncbi:MAG: hypothetical protein DRO01_07710 [Thermoproteota archaeon]|nr:MAG: hypothetical protein DRO01_07710 [Candidatus Korarchaeota archaeon]
MNQITTIDQIDAHVLSKAKDMYFSGIYPTEISATLDIPNEIIRVCCFGYDESGNDPACWFNERKSLPSTSAHAYTKVRSIVLDNIEAALSSTALKMSVQIEKDLKERLQKLAVGEETDPISADELTKIVTVMEKVNKIGRLERGEATEINEINMGSWSARDVMEYERGNNPLFDREDIIDAEYKDNKVKELTEEQE